MRFDSSLGLNEWYVESTSRPQVTINSVEVPFLNTSTYVAGRFVWGTINVTFSELQSTAGGTPQLRLFFDGQLPQNDPDAAWTIDIDTTQSLKKYTVNMIESTGDARTWYHVVDMSTILEAWDGYLWVQVASSDLAGNSFKEDSLSFANSCLLDNTKPIAKITYTNQRDTLLTTMTSLAQKLNMTELQLTCYQCEHLHVTTGFC
jgi:hypothetical protein